MQSNWDLQAFAVTEMQVIVIVIVCLKLLNVVLKYIASKRGFIDKIYSQTKIKHRWNIFQEQTMNTSEQNYFLVKFVILYTWAII